MQKLTEFGRARFEELTEGIKDGSLLEKWSKEKVPKTKAELVEERQIKALGAWVASGNSLEELHGLKWRRLEFFSDGDRVLVRAQRR